MTHRMEIIARFLSLSLALSGHFVLSINSKQQFEAILVSLEIVQSSVISHHSSTVHFGFFLSTRILER